MKLRSLRIDQYGPLDLGELELADGVTLVAGPNESGKTLLVEALHHLLVGEPPGDPRVSQAPMGWLDVECDGETRRLADGTSLVDACPAAFAYEPTPAELRNVLLVRDADLRLSAEDAFYERVTDHLTGLRTADIRRLMAGVRDRGRLTPKELDISNSRENDSAREQLEDARELIGDIETYLDEAERDGLDSLERRRLEATRERAELEGTVAELERAREWEQLADLRETASRLEGALSDRAALPDEEALADLESRLDEVESARGEEAAHERRVETAPRLAGLALAGALIAFVALLVLGRDVLAATVPLGFLVLAAWQAAGWYRAARSLSALAATRDEVVDRAQRLGIDADTVDGVNADLADLGEEREALSRTIQQCVGTLRNALDLDEASPAAVLDRAERRLDRREAGLEAVERAFDPDALAGARDDLDDVEAELERLEDRMREHRDRLDEFERRLSEVDVEAFTGEPAAVDLAGLESIERAAARLEEVVETIERDATRSRRAHEILSEMEREESRKVTGLFGPGSRATAVFERITDDRYVSVRYDAAGERPVVERDTGRELSPLELSRGARDQLYLAIRIALAEELASDGAGFLVMDDAFLAADADRLARQVDLVSDLAAEGWQVVYLSAKADAIDALSAAAGVTHELGRVP